MLPLHGQYRVHLSVQHTGIQPVPGQPLQLAAPLAILFELLFCSSGRLHTHTHFMGPAFEKGPGRMVTGICGAGGLPSEAWEAVRGALMPAVKACLLPGSQAGWHDAGDACFKAEPICEALSLYHLLLSREAQQRQSLTGLP